MPPFNRWVSWGRGDELDTWLDLQARRGGVAWCKQTVVLDLIQIPALRLPAFVILSKKSHLISLSLSFPLWKVQVYDLCDKAGVRMK